MAFIQARNYTRVTGKPRSIDLICLHTMEYPERPTGAEWCAQYFASRTAPKASAHYCVDADSTVQCVRDEDVAWAAPGANHNGIQIEHAGYAKQTLADWADPYSQAMLKRSAELTARLCKRHSIPVRSLKAPGLLRGLRGITTHAAVSEAFKRSNHWDPGKDFPMSQYLLLVKDAMARVDPPKPPVVRPPGVLDPVVTSTSNVPFTYTSTTDTTWRVDVFAGDVRLVDQDPASPVVQSRLRRLFARFKDVAVVWKRK